MSVELSSPSGSLGQFASNNGFSDLIAASQKDSILKKFFDDANTEKVKIVESALNDLKSGDPDVDKTAKQLAALMHGQDCVFITNGTYDGDDEEASKAYGEDAWNSDPEDESEQDDRSGSEDENEDFDKMDEDKLEFDMVPGSIIKLDKVKHQVFGWFSITSVQGRKITDTQGDIIDSDVIEDAAYDFVLNARKGGEMHQSGKDGEIKGIGRLIESVVFTAEKQAAMLQSLHDQGIKDAELDFHGTVCWWGGFFVEDKDTWKKIENGELRAFSIGGRGKRAAYTEI